MSGWLYSLGSIIEYLQSKSEKSQEANGEI